MSWGPWCGMWGPGYWFGGPWGVIIALLFWALVIAGLVYLVKLLIRQGDGNQAAVKDTPLEILRRRYAVGEITAEEFKKARENLS
ncbi:MAG: hypothetical protein KatS3mg007_1860 [Thermoanaerobaculum sp.]|nr:MAG: hypothetical protein KatS3mg007_1860 [Thermoanaerobaculum sp.]